MATRYEVRWMETGDVWHKRGFAFMTGAIALFERLCQNERDGGGVTCPLVEHLGPNGERAEYPVAVSEPGKGVPA